MHAKQSHSVVLHCGLFSACAQIGITGKELFSSHKTAPQRLCKTYVGGEQVGGHEVRWSASCVYRQAKRGGLRPEISRNYRRRRRQQSAFCKMRRGVLSLQSRWKDSKSMAFFTFQMPCATLCTEQGGTPTHAISQTAPQRRAHLVMHCGFGSVRKSGDIHSSSHGGGATANKGLNCQRLRSDRHSATMTRSVLCRCEQIRKIQKMRDAE